jgi:hypothetical protein
MPNPFGPGPVIPFAPLPPDRPGCVPHLQGGEGGGGQRAKGVAGPRARGLAPKLTQLLTALGVLLSLLWSVTTLIRINLLSDLYVRNWHMQTGVPNENWTRRIVISETPCRAYLSCNCIGGVSKVGKRNTCCGQGY